MSGAWSRQSQPYPGLESFQRHDRRRFFGRTNETRRLKSLVISESLSLLHAPSGAGKTSLINAGIVAPIETDHRWLVTTMRPEGDPLQSLAHSILLTMFPEPETDARILSTALDVALRSESDLIGDEHTVTLSALKTVFQDKPIGKVPVEGENLESGSDLISLLDEVFDLEGDENDQIEGVASRFVQYNDGQWILTRYLAWIFEISRQYGVELSIPPTVSDAVTSRDADDFEAKLAQCPVKELVTFFRSQELSELRSQFRETQLGYLSNESPFALANFLENLSEDTFFLTVFGQENDTGIGSPPGLLVVLDQFEEVFTQIEFDVRDAFFEQFENAYRICGEASTETRALPIHFLVSMRDEYVADLDRLRSFSSRLSSNTYHLGFISETEISDIIKIPAQQFGFTIQDQVVDRIIGDLRLPDSTVEPSLIQIILSYVWRKFENRLRDEDHARLSVEDFAELGTTEEIMSRHIVDVVDGAGSDDDSDLGPLYRFELLDILDHLTRKGDFRTILSEEELLYSASRRASDGDGNAGPSARKRMLDYAVSNGLVRRYRQKGYGGAVNFRNSTASTIVEVTHERLIPGISSLLMNTLRVETTFRYLQSGRAKLNELSLREARRSFVPLFERAEIQALAEFADRFDFDARAIEILFRSALIAESPAEVLSRLASILDAASISVEPSAKLDSVRQQTEQRRWLDRSELRVLDSEGWSGHDEAVREYLLHSLMAECAPGDEDLIIRFGQEIF